MTSQQYITELQNTLSLLSTKSIDEVVGILHEARLSRRNIFVLGNGGHRLN